MTHSFDLVQEFEEGTTGDSLLADTAFGASVTTGLVDGVASAVPALAGAIDASNIFIDEYTLGAARRLLEGTPRRLPPMKLTVDYSVLIPSSVSVSPEDLGATLVANKGAFESTLSSSYAAAYKANTGNDPPGFTGVVASEVAGVKVVTVAPPTQAPTQAPVPVSDTVAPSAPSKPKAAEEEEDNTGMIVGIVVGVILGVAALGGIFYMYKKKKAAE
jgi:hypothetical protein